MSVLTPPLRDAVVGAPSASVCSAVPPLVGLAIMISVTVLIGWSTNDASIAGFGNRVLLMQPWTAIACISLGASFFCAASRRIMAARVFVVVPLTIGLFTITQEWTDFPSAIERALFSDAISNQARVAPGRPGLMSALLLLLLSLASLTTIATSPVIRRLTTALGCLALSLVLMSGALLPLGITAWGPQTRFVLIPLPTAFALAAIALATILQRRHTAWPISAHCTLHGTTMQWVLVPCILLPVAFAILQLWNDNSGWLSQEMAEIAQAALQVVVSCTIVIWTWVRVGQERTARWAFSTAIDAAPVALTDLNGRIIRWSKGCERLYGWSAKEARGQDKHSLTQAQLPTGPATTLEADRPHEVEITELHRDGTRLRILETSRLIQPRPDIAPMVVIFMTDITEHHRAKQAMLASEARLSFAADLHELGLFEWSEASDIMQLSPQAERLFDLKPGEFSGNLAEWRSLVRQTFGEDILPDFPLPALSEQRHSFRLRSTRAGQPHIIEGSIFFYDRPGDRGSSMLGLIMDATERERRTEILAAREFELRSILETVPAAVITLDQTGHVRSFSRTAEHLFGYASAEIVGNDIRRLLPDYSVIERDARVENSVKTETLPSLCATTGRDCRGNDVPLEIVLGSMTIGKELITVAFIRSLREQIATQARLGELREQLLHAARVSAMGEIGAGLAHELNQPLTATANYLGAVHMRLDRETEPDQIRDLVELANQQVLRAGEIIRRMRNFVARGELDIRAFPLDELITDALHLARSGTRHAGVNLQYLPSASALEVLADQVQIQQVLVNIISNSLDAFASDATKVPQIAISSIEQPNGTVLIRFQDNGPGFPSSIVDRRFETFVSTRKNGLGLGLSICRRIVEGHRGALTFCNGPEGGAIIEFTLPVYSRYGDTGLRAAG